MMANNYGVSRRTLLGVGGLMLGVGLVGCSDSEAVSYTHLTLPTILLV